MIAVHCHLCNTLLLEDGRVVAEEGIALCCECVKAHWNALREQKLMKEHSEGCAGYHWWCIPSNQDRIQALDNQCKGDKAIGLIIE